MSRVPEKKFFERIGGVSLALLLTIPFPLAPATIVVDGACTLPDAVAAANGDAAVGGCSAGSGADTVRLTGDVALGASIPTVTSELEVDGQGFTISNDVGHSGRFFDANGSANLTVSNVVLTGGSVSGSADGAAIKNTGVLRVEDSFILNNSTGFDGSGGGIFNGGMAVVVNSTIANNYGEEGGGIYSDFNASTTLIDSTLANNYSFWEGSGLFSYEGNVTISGSTITGNENGGVVVFYPFNDVTIVNSTISGNGGDGFYDLGGSGTIRVESSTFYGNGGNMKGYSYGNGSLANNVFADPGGDGCSLFGFTDEGGNVDGNGSCLGGVVLTGFDTALADNGGPTQTHALLAGSSAIDAAGACDQLIDQRGFGRDASCDAGSYEFEGAPAIVSSVGGLIPQVARCRNVSAAGSVSFVASDWNCRGEGLAISSGDRIQQTVRGRPSSPQLTGSVEGISNGRVLCQNLLTGQSVQFPLGAETAFNCREQGLEFASDNLVSWTVTGVAD